VRTAALAASILIVASATPAVGAPALALPPFVRINIGLNGTSYAVVASTATLVATAPDGRELYRGIGRLVARTDVRRLADGVAIPPPTRRQNREEYAERAELLREARFAERDSARTMVHIPFEIGALSSVDDDLGTPIFSAERIQPIRFAAEDGGLLSFNGRVYRGTFELADDRGRIIVINTAPTDRYLASVVGTEIPTDWHRHALAAQAVAARTYLVKRIGSRGAFDLHGDERDQAYSGLRGETTSTLRAVADTAGLVATYRGNPIDAFYSANAGGHTENSENVWVTPLPYLRGVTSPGDEIALRSSWGASSYEWTKEYTEPVLRQQLERLGVSVGTIQSIDIVERSPAGRVMRARIVGSAGTRDVRKDSTRWHFGVKSQMFSVTFRPANDLEAVEVPERGEERDRALKRVAELDALGAERIHELVRAEAVTDGDGIVLSDFRSAGYIYRLPARIVFSGKGFGHGVGMSQWGMQGMATSGASFDQILKHYYRGIELTRTAGP